MKKIIIFLIILLVTPNLTLASWWNPMTWGTNDWYKNTYKEDNTVKKTNSETFKKEKNSSYVVATTTQQVETKFYIKYTDSRVRSCPSLECDIIGYQAQNSEIIRFDSKKLTLNDLEEWILVTFPEGNKGYLNKSLLSKNPVTPTKTSASVKTESSTKITSDEQKIMRDWISTINNERQEVSEYASQLLLGNTEAYTSEVIDVYSAHKTSLDNISRQMNGIYQDTYINSNNGQSQREKFSALIVQFKKNITEFNSILRVAVDNSLSKKEIIENQRQIRNINNQYKQLQMEQDALNQVRTAEINAQVEQYKNIRAVGASEGATEGVVNSQLNAAGLIKQTNCYYSSVGGMTPGAGSVTCY